MAANLFQPSLNRVTDADGNPVSGAKMHFYLTGTTTPATYYTNQAGTVAGTNPLVSDADGLFDPAYLDPDTDYRVKLTNSAGSETYFDVDPLPGFDASMVTNAAADALAAQVAAEAAQTAAETAEANAEAAAIALQANGFRVAPNAIFSSVFPIVARAEAPGRAELSESAPSYAVRVHSGFIGSGVVYVDPVAGNDANSGSAATAPVLTISDAVRVENPSEVIVFGSDDPANPVIARKFDFRSTDAPGNKLKIIRVRGHVIVEEEGSLASALTWTNAGSYWETTPTLVSAVPPHVIEYKGWVRDDGNPFRLPYYATAAEINSVGGGIGWSWDGTKIYIRIGVLNIESNKADLKITYANALSRCLFSGPIKILFDIGPDSSLVFNGVHHYHLYSSGKPRVYAKGIEIRNSASHGVDANASEYWYEECTIFASKNDNFHPADSGGNTTICLEANCISTEAGDFDTFGVTVGGTNNGSSMHGGGSPMRAGGIYEKNGGPNIVDTGTGYSFNIGVIARGGRATSNAFGFYATTSAMTMWLDTCHSQDERNAEIAATAGCTVYKYKTTGKTQTASGGGVITTYTPTFA